MALKETRTSEKKFLKGVYHFTLPPAFKITFKASKEVYLVFDREVFAGVKGEVLGEAKGQKIRPSLGGFGDPVTDWFFRSSLRADGAAAFAAVRPDGVAGDVVWWITYAARWKQASTWAGPDALFTFALDAAGQVIAQVPAELAFPVIKGVRPADIPAALSVPQLSGAMAAALTQLKATVPGDIDERHLNLFPLHLIYWSA